MSASNKTFLFFLKCPNLENLMSFSIDLPRENQENSLSLFHRRILKCRQLLFSEADIIATPENFSKSQIAAVIPRAKFYSAEFKSKLEMMGLKIVKFGDTSPRVLQECLQYTAVARLAPQWNSVQNLLVQGRNFLTASEPLKAAKLDVFVNDNEISLCVTPTCVKLPHFKMENFVTMNEMSRTSSFIMNEKVHVLPSLKKGKAVCLSKSILKTSLFQNYLDVKKHWKNMYGYRLPDIPEENIWYVNIQFSVPNSTPLTYPYYCVRPFGMTEIPRVDPQLTLRSFITDFCKKMGNICNEKCQILDLKASFPLLQLYPAADVLQHTASRIGTTYTMVQSVPYRSRSVTQTGDESHKIKMQNESPSVTKLKQNHVKSCENNSSLSTENSLRNMIIEKSNTIHGNPLSYTDTDKAFEMSFLAHRCQIKAEKNGGYMFHHESAVNSPDLLCSKKLNDADSNMTTFDYKNASTPMSSRGTDTSQSKCESIPPQRYAPIFLPKKSKQPVKTPTEIFYSMKSPKHSNTVSVVNTLFDIKERSLELDFASAQDVLVFSGDTNTPVVARNGKLSKRHPFKVSDEIKKVPRNADLKSCSRKLKGHEDTLLESNERKKRKSKVSSSKRTVGKSTKC